MIRVSCSFDSSIGRFQLEDYVRELDVAVFAFDDVGQRVLVGRIAATQVRWADAEIDGESLFDICDSDSQGLYEVYRTLTNKSGNDSGGLEGRRSCRSRHLRVPDRTASRVGVLPPSHSGVRHYAVRPRIAGGHVEGHG